jgi:NADH:ubiquinone oxidoreductase subunit
MAKKAIKKQAKRRAWEKAHVKELKDHSRAKTPVAKISKVMKRTAGALRQKALQLGISLGHRR